MKDLIERQIAFDQIGSMFAVTPTQKDMVEDCLEIIENLPSAQPEIIRCKECKYMIDTGDDLMCDNAKGWVVATTSDFGCVLAERRTDEGSD